MKNKYIIYTLIPVLIISIGFIIYKFFLNTEKQFVWKILSDKEFSKDIFKENSNSWFSLSEDDLNDIKSKIRTLCNVWSVEKLTWSNSFTVIKKMIFKKIEDSYKEQFLYIDLPTLVYSTCWLNIDNTFAKQLLTYLQNDWDTLIKVDNENINKVNKLIDNLSFEYDDKNKSQLKLDSTYFNKVFFEDNLDNINSVYFPDYMINTTNSKEFFYSYSTPLSLTESNENLQKS